MIKSDELYTDGSNRCSDILHYYRMSQERLAKGRTGCLGGKESKKGETPWKNCLRQKIK